MEAGSKYLFAKQTVNERKKSYSYPFRRISSTWTVCKISITLKHTEYINCFLLSHSKYFQTLMLKRYDSSYRKITYFKHFSELWHLNFKCMVQLNWEALGKILKEWHLCLLIKAECYPQSEKYIDVLSLSTEKRKDPSTDSVWNTAKMKNIESSFTQFISVLDRFSWGKKHNC